jgi:hypothetical protein
VISSPIPYSTTVTTIAGVCQALRAATGKPASTLTGSEGDKA